MPHVGTSMAGTNRRHRGVTRTPGMQVAGERVGHFVNRVSLPVLPLNDAVVLPGMVVPFELDKETQAVVDAAQLGRDDETPRRLLLVPRTGSGHGPIGVVAEIAQIGRLPGGESAVVLKAVQRARVEIGVSGPGTALWVEATPLDDPEPADDEAAQRLRDLTREYRAVLVSILQQRTPGRSSTSSSRSTSRRARRHGRLLAVARPRPEGRAAGDARRRGSGSSCCSSGRATPWPSSRWRSKIRDDVREGMDKTQREFLLRQQLAAIRKELGEGEADDARRLPRPGSRRRTCPRRCARPRSREVDRLERTVEQSPRAGWIRTWLDTVLELPWSVTHRRHHRRRGGPRRARRRPRTASTT